jgi:hypothetical protein
MKEFLDLHYTNDNDNSRVLDIFLPDNNNFTTVLWFHGGGIVGAVSKAVTFPKDF